MVDFQIGDRVRLIKHDRYTRAERYEVGQVYMIYQVRHYGQNRISFAGSTYWHNSDLFEPIGKVKRKQQKKLTW